ncbi:hypothetical protein [Nocardiopsis lucentensis]|uniref:hypothetical protein n=1 Tax=Nocardiopsis lucentensis TaxID=53441 RepID=UPI00034CA4C6|nr:hypothetical protein [Nocardiopsis lucentensis]
MQPRPDDRAPRGASPHRRLSVTLDTLPTNIPFLLTEVAPGHELIVARDGITYGALADAYITSLPTWARQRMFASVGVVDPHLDWNLYQRLAWWDEEWPVSPTSVRIVETAVPGLLTPWKHEWLD